MADTLQQTERDQILNSLTSEQIQFIKDYVKRGKRTAFANEMAKSKGMVIPEEATDQDIKLILDEWILEDYIDNGFVNPETPCECGKPLRYQYIVRHIGTNESRRFGINHFEEHMSFPAALIKQIKQGFTQVDYELDELITKIKEGWNLNQHIEFIPEDLQLPDDINEQIQMNLPLLDSQISRLKKRIDNYLQPAYTPKIKRDNHEDQNDIFQFELFTGVASPATQLNSTSLVLTQQHKDLILHYLETTGSARIISELLIKKHNANSVRYLTGKPKLYLPICIYLDELVEKSILILKEIRGKDDRIYSLFQD